MTAFEKITPGKINWPKPLLLPAAFRWRDPATNLLHQGAVITWPDGRVVGYTLLCTDTLEPRWSSAPSDEDSFVSCLECLGAREQDE